MYCPKTLKPNPQSSQDRRTAGAAASFWTVSLGDQILRRWVLTTECVYTMYQIYCEAPRTLDICLNRLLTSVLEWPVLSVQSLLCLHLRPHIAYLSRASMPTRLTVLSMVQLWATPFYAGFTITIGTLSQILVKGPSIHWHRKPEIWVSP